jgi:hypothetical protein
MTVQDRGGNGLNDLAPPVLVRISGTWHLAHGEVVLAPISVPTYIHFARQFTLIGPNAVDGLQPLYGAGYIPPFKFVRVAASEVP